MSTRRRASLIARIERHYRIGRVTIDVEGTAYQIAKVADPDSVFLDSIYDDRQSQDGEVAWQPYWAQAWESSVALAREIAATEEPGQRLLDLGCGVGVVGAIAAARGIETVLGDIAQPGLLFARLNVWPWRERATVRRIDWQKDLLEPKFDTIACADIVYDHRDWDDLDRFWRVHLTRTGKVLVAEPSRISGREFREGIVQRGWNLVPAGVRRVGRREVILSRLTLRG